MAFSVSVPPAAPADFDQAVELALQAARADLALTGSRHAAELAAQAAKDLIKNWDIASEKGRTFGATLEGHANPGGTPAAGAPNDTISVTVWRSDDKIPSFDQAVADAVEAELARRDAKQARSDARATAKAEREQAAAELAPVETAPASDALSESNAGLVQPEIVTEG